MEIIISGNFFPYLFDGEDESIGLLTGFESIQQFNKFLHNPNGFKKFVGKYGDYLVHRRIETSEFGLRRFDSLRIMNLKKQRGWVQPVYRSSGKNHGTTGLWFPTAGVITSLGNKVRYDSRCPPGWITKHFFMPDPYNKWVRHEKTSESLPPTLVEILKNL